MARLVSGPSVMSVISPGTPPRLLEDEVDGVAVGQGGARRRQLGVAEALRSVRLLGRLERADERDLAPERDLDVGATGELEDRPGVDADLAGVDVARHAGRGDDLGVGRSGGVEQGEAVVDAGVDVEDERRALGGVGHRLDASREHRAPARRPRSSVRSSTSTMCAPIARASGSRCAAWAARKTSGCAP